MSSDIRRRLDRLKGSAPARPSALAERLALLRPRQAGSGRSNCVANDGAVAALLGGDVVADGLVLVRHALPLSHAHGNKTLAQLLEADLVMLAGDGKHFPADLLFLDTETTGLAGGTGTLAFLLGLARVEGDQLVVRQYFLTRFGGEAALWERAGPWLQEAAAFASFNGKSFDVPLIATRMRLNGRQDPAAGKFHLDLLHPLRRAYGRLWPDCRLQSAERRLLGLQRRGDLPSAMVPEVWSRWLRRGETGALPELLHHNYVDLLSLIVLVPTLALAHGRPDARREDVPAVARGHLARGDEALARACLEARWRDLDAAGLLDLARLRRRRNDWAGAVELWTLLAQSGDVAALEHLAKYHEHQRKDYATALELARRLSRLDGGSETHRRRQLRLQRKMAEPGLVSTS